MQSLLLAAALAVSASAQVGTKEQNAAAAAFKQSAKNSARSKAPAAVDPKTFSALKDLAYKYGRRTLMRNGEIANVIEWQEPPDASGSVYSFQANLIEQPETVENKSKSKSHDLVMRRYFTRFEAASDERKIDPISGGGHGETWRFVFSIDGKLLQVERVDYRVELIAGQYVPIGPQAHSSLMSPSDSEVQKRWKAASKKLLGLGESDVY